jgi:hypothetical protein
MAIDFAASAEKILAGTFLARSTYGAEYIDSAFWVGGDNDAEKADDYRGFVNSKSGWHLLDQSDLPTFNDRGGDSRFTAGGLFDSRAFTATTNSYDAQGLLAVKDGDTLVLAFRGTDGEDPAVLSGQAFTGQGLAANYKAFKLLINAAYDYLKAHPEITDVVVSGHSLGGALADVFALVDAARFRELRPDGLTIVSLGSSGVPKDLPEFLGGFDKGVADIVNDKLVSLNLPGDYISISNTLDRAHFADKFPDIPEAAGLVPILTLKANLQFGGDLLFRTPNIKNTDVQYYDIIDHPFDFRGMGAQHNSALLWTNLESLVNDDLFFAYGGQRLTAGVTDYEHASDIDGSSISLFQGYDFLGDRERMSDRGERTLTGNGKNDYILGLDGSDRLEGAGGRDLLSGGDGRDQICGGNGADTLSGGKGQDKLRGGGGDDTLYFGSSGQSRPGSEADVVVGFQQGRDVLDVADVDARAGKAGDQAFAFIASDDFTSTGQVRAVQHGDDVLLQFNIRQADGAEMVIVLSNYTAGDVTGADFIL